MIVMCWLLQSTPMLVRSSLVATVPGSVCSVFKRQRESLRRPLYTAVELLEIFEGHGLIQSVHGLKPFLDLL
ncbi:MAG: hypothetical protein ACOYKN_21400, partial [Pirellula sp.]